MAPSFLRLDPVPEGAQAHCDNADFLDSMAFGLKVEYPRSREQATAQLQECVSHLRERFAEGVDAADKIVGQHARILTPEVDISILDCRFSFPLLQMHMFSRSKCSAIEGFGRSLHGIQDFYAHSNWVDDAPEPYSTKNPPGLGRDDLPAFLDLRAETEVSEQVPHHLSTGCFGGLLTDGPIGKAGHPLEPGSLDCTGRITHHTLNKDNGIIDWVTGAASKPGPNTPRSDYAANFERAVSAAIRDSRRQWRHFREEIRRTYGAQRGNMMVCAIVRDDPTRDCYSRRIAFLRDHGNHVNRVAEMQIPVYDWLLQEVEGKAHDEGPGEILQNATKSRGASDELRKRVLRDEQAPSETMECSPSDQGLDFESALAELRDTTNIPIKKTSIVALSCAPPESLKDHIARLWRAGDEGIRVHLGLLPPSSTASVSNRTEEQDLITAVIRTGGTFAAIHGHHNISKFVEHVISRGLTEYDNARDTAIILLPGLSISEYVTPESEPRRFSFDAHTMDKIIIVVAPITNGLSLRVALRHVRRNTIISKLDIGPHGNATFRTQLGVGDIPRTDAWFELEIEHVKGDGLVGSGLFEVSIETEDVRKNDGHGEVRRADDGSSHDEL